MLILRFLSFDFDFKSFVTPFVYHNDILEIVVLLKK